jgi:hypothetical protein
MSESSAPSPDSVVSEWLANLSPDQKDLFCGEDAVRSFSARLAVGLGDEIADAEVAEVLGQQAIPYFRYAQRSLHGFVRRTTGEPAFCHSADIALRALDLGYSARVVQAALLHDTVEDRSKSLEEVLLHLKEIETLFGWELAQDVRHSTNVYSVILRNLDSKVSHDLAFDDSAKPALLKGIDDVRREMPEELRHKFGHEFSQLLEYFVHHVQLAEGARKARVDRKYTAVSELRLRSYQLFVEDIHTDARYRHGLGKGFHDVTLVVKSLDLIDNLRTSEVANFASLERILLKAETFLDCTFFLHDEVRAMPHVRTSLIQLYDYLKYHLVEQLLERKRALIFLADTRFAFLADYLMREVVRLQAKYKVHGNPLTELVELRQKVRDFNLSAVESAATPH